MSDERLRADAGLPAGRAGHVPRRRLAPVTAATRRAPSHGAAGRAAGDRCRRSGGLAKVHALIAAGDSAMAAVLVGSVFISSPDAARSKVLLFQLISVAPFAIVAPLIGPWLDRIPGGRRFVVQLTALARAAAATC